MHDTTPCAREFWLDMAEFYGHPYTGTTESSFFSPLRKNLPHGVSAPVMMSAMEMAAQYHRLQWRKGTSKNIGGEPFVRHLAVVTSIGIAMGITDSDDLATLLLHDAEEDAFEQYLLNMFLIKQSVSNNPAALSALQVGPRTELFRSFCKAFTKERQKERGLSPREQEVEFRLKRNADIAGMFGSRVASQVHYLSNPVGMSTSKKRERQRQRYLHKPENIKLLKLCDILSKLVDADYDTHWSAQKVACFFEHAVMFTNMLQNPPPFAYELLDVAFGKLKPRESTEQWCRNGAILKHAMLVS